MGNSIGGWTAAATQDLDGDPMASSAGQRRPREAVPGFLCESTPKWNPTAESHQPFDISVGISFALGSRSAPIGVQSEPHQNA